MKIALLQMDIVLRSPEENCGRIEKMLIDAMQESPDVIVLPEMWNIGFFPNNPRLFADDYGKMAKEFLSKWAKQYRVNIVGGTVASVEGAELVNINYNINRQGDVIGEYRKIHLFSPSGEDKIFSSGKAIKTFLLDGVKVGVIVCYDIRFCELVRLLALENIAVLFVPAAWPKPRLAHWQILLKARAIENQLFVVGVNGVGIANDLKFCGGSMIVDPWGEVIAEAHRAEQCCIYGEIDLSIMQDIRKSINVFQDRRISLYTLGFRD